MATLPPPPKEAADETEETDLKILPFERALLKVRVNKTWVRRFTEAGLRLVRRTPSREDEIEAGHVDQRGERHYLRLGNRVNAAGQDKGDSGIARIKFNPNDERGGNPADPTKAIRVDLVFLDLMAAGYVMADMHILKRDGEQRGMGFLVIVFKEGVEPFKAQPECLSVAQALFERFYRSVFVWENPDDTATINANMAVVGPELVATTDTRALRFAFITGESKTRWDSRIIAKTKPFAQFYDPASEDSTPESNPEGAATSA